MAFFKKYKDKITNNNKKHNKRIKMEKLINILKNKKFIFVNGYPGVGKTRLINILKKEKEFQGYAFEEWSEYLRGEKQIFSLKEPKFIEIKNIEDIDLLLSKAQNLDEIIRNFWRNGILINLNTKGNQITNTQGKNYYAYAFHLPIEEGGIISIENLFDDNNKVLDVYITDLDWLQEEISFINNN